MRPPAAALEMIDRIAVLSHRSTGWSVVVPEPGLLACRPRQPEAYALATDIDPVAIEVAEDNALVNGVALGREPGQCALIVADGTRHR